MVGHTYQENYLPAAMAKLGHEVTIIAGVDNPEFFTETPHTPGDTIEDQGVIVRYVKIRYLRFHTPIEGIFDLLAREKPDLVFVHGFVLARSFGLAGYAKRFPECVFCADTHETYLLAYNACFSGSVRDRIRRTIYFRIVYRLWSRWMQRRYRKIFYVAPPRKTFAVRELKIAQDRLSPLWLGADFETLPYDRKDELRRDLRARLGLPQNAHIMILAGKLDEKKRPVELAEAFLRLNDPGWWLLYVGSVEEPVRARIDRAAGGTGRVLYTGFLSGEAVLEHIAASDLAVYPGAHSVLWEQTVCLGIPGVFYEQEPGDAAHLSDPAGPNAEFLKTGDADELSALLSHLIKNEPLLLEMGVRARQYGEKNLSYAALAKRVMNEVFGAERQP